MNPRPSGARVSLRSLGRLRVSGAGLWGGFGLSASLVWFLVSVTPWGTWLALLGAALAILPLALRRRHTRPEHRRRWTWIGVGLGTFVAIIGTGLLVATPTGRPPQDSPVQQHFVGGSAFPRFSVANVVPEIEQLNLGLQLLPFGDGLLTRDRARRLASFTTDYYRQMDRDPDFRSLGSAMGGAYADLLGGSYPAGHYYLYFPRSAPPGPRPAIVFLHGSAGNFKVYTWIWSRLAEQLGCVIIAPSFGFGFWDRPEAVETVRRALADAQTVVTLDPRRLFLAGLSNGGLGVSRVAAAMPGAFCGCILISPVLADAMTDDPEFQRKWAGRPMLFLTGEVDDRVPVDYVRERVRRLHTGGVLTTLVTYPGEDHFLFFSQRDPVLQAIARWMQTADPHLP